jgi:hypothetical protein
MNYHKYFCDLCEKQIDGKWSVVKAFIKYTDDISSSYWNLNKSFEICFECADGIVKRNRSKEDRQKDCEHDISSKTDRDGIMTIKCEKCNFEFEEIRHVVSRKK